MKRHYDFFRSVLFIMLKANYSKEAVYFTGDTLEEQLLASEALHANRVESFEHDYVTYENGHENRKTKIVSELNWHSLITRGDTIFSKHPIHNTLNRWGIDLVNVETVQPLLEKKRRKYRTDGISLKEFMETAHYKSMLERVKLLYGGPLSNGSSLFQYQLEGAALIAARRRLLLGLDMGLGKTLTTLVGLTSNASNKKILIVTMSRNIADWVREMKVLGLQNDYIELRHRTDIRSGKRIHIVSYERWASETTLFKAKLYDECPSCKNGFSWDSAKQQCNYCNKSFEGSEEPYTIKDLPEDCPMCEKEWGKGKLFCGCGFTVVKSRKKALYRFFNRSYDACAVDEAHLIKNGTTKRSRSIRAIKTKTRIALTGTPAENGADDLYWPSTWIYGDSHHFENPYELQRFQAYGRKGEENFRGYFGGASRQAVMDSKSIEARVSHQEKLWSLLDKFMFRKKKTDADVERDVRIPEPQHRRLHLALEEAERSLYDKRLDEFRVWYAEEYAKRESAAIRGDVYRISTIEVCQWLDKLRKVASCPWIHPDYDYSTSTEPVKLQVTKEKIKEYARSGKKMLIFTAHKQTAEELGVLLDTVVPGMRAAYIHGGVPMAYRHELMDQFQNPNHPLSILVMTMRTGAESYTLTEAKAVILYDLDFNSKKIEQCYSRAVRLGQKDVVEVLWLVGVDTIDANLHALVLSKKSGVDLAIDRQKLDFVQVSKEFEAGENVEMEPGVDYQQFATDMLKRGTSRADYVS